MVEVLCQNVQFILKKEENLCIAYSIAIVPGDFKSISLLSKTM